MEPETNEDFFFGETLRSAVQANHTYNGLATNVASNTQEENDADYARCLQEAEWSVTDADLAKHCQEERKNEDVASLSTDYQHATLVYSGDFYNYLETNDLSQR
jgi:hypothetical protein